MTTAATRSASDTAALQVRGITKSYGQVEALRGVDLEVSAGQVTALIGDNGAGKSTLIKILSGTEQPDSGQILLHGEAVHLPSPIAARAAGLETVFQDLALAPDLDAAANLFLGRELRRRGLRGVLGWLDKSAMRATAADAFASLGVAINDVTAPIASYSGGQRQGVAVARSAHWATSVLLLDEPTAALGVVQTRHVLDLIRRIRDTGIAVILVSHSMPDVLAVSDRIGVLRLGRRVADLARAEASTETLIAAMTGLAEQNEDEASLDDNPAPPRRPGGAS